MIEKRVILEHLSGARKGLRQITGRLSSDNSAHTDLCPASLNGLAELSGGSAILTRVEPTYVLYREWISPAKAQE